MDDVDEEEEEKQCPRHLIFYTRAKIQPKKHTEHGKARSDPCEVRALGGEKGVLRFRLKQKRQSLVSPLCIIRRRGLSAIT